MSTWKSYNFGGWFYSLNMNTGRYKKNTFILFFGPLKHIQNSKLTDADIWKPLLVSDNNTCREKILNEDRDIFE